VIIEPIAAAPPKPAESGAITMPAVVIVGEPQPKR
jgi:hypothetical protein